MERNQFDHGWPHWPKEPVRQVRCPFCDLLMQTDVEIRGDGLLTCPRCYQPFDSEEK